MEQFLWTVAASFAGAIFALIAVRYATGSKVSGGGAAMPGGFTARHKTARLMAAGVFAVVMALLVTMVSDGQLAAGLGGIAALVSLAVLSFAVRTVR